MGIDFLFRLSFFEQVMTKTFPALRRFHYYHLHSDVLVPLNCFSISGQRLRSGHPQLPYPVKGLQKCINPLVVTQYSVYYPSTSGDDLDRYSHQTVKKPPKLHGEKFIPGFTVFSPAGQTKLSSSTPETP